ncbi:hypothetical protein GC194_11225 [bacterium]|nr:hypothetical protein [bacterium]
MQSVFKSATGVFPGIVFWGTIVLLVVLFVVDIVMQRLNLSLYFHLFDALVVAFLLWIWLKTEYIIDGDQLKCQAGPFTAKFAVSDIKKVDMSKRMWSGYRPALSFDGMVVYYHKYDEIFISPKDKEGFLSVLKRMNPTIEIVGNEA